LLWILPTLSHSNDDVFDDIKDHTTLKKVNGSFLVGAGLDSMKGNATVCDNASANSSLVAKINDWLSKLNYKNEPEHMINPIFCFVHSIHEVVLVLLEYIDFETTEIQTYVKSLHWYPKLSNEQKLKISERNKSALQKNAVKIFKISLLDKTCIQHRKC
jgi:hypothetical protein